MLHFRYHRPGSLGDALALIQEAPDGRFLAGGMTLVPTLKHRLASVSDLVDLARVPELQGVRQQGDHIVIGAMTSHAAVAASPLIRESIPALAALASGIGDAQVRHRGTIGGSIANNDPSADYPAACLGLEAMVLTDRREIPAARFFKSLFETALDRHEIVVGVRFPIPKRAGYAKFANPASRYAMVGVFVSETTKGCIVAATGAGRQGVYRVREIEGRLANSFSPAVLRDLQLGTQDLLSDLHCSAAYRAHLIAVMSARAVAIAAGIPLPRRPLRHGGPVQPMQ